MNTVYQDTFSSYHPLVNLLYFVLVLLFTMFVLHPAILLISLLTGISYAVQLKGWAGLGKSLWYLLCLGLFAIAVNVAFNHEGATILGYMPSGNPLTLESMLYGIAAAAMLVAAIVWFGCFTVVMTSDKLIYLFGRVLPAFSLVLSMTLRFVPRFKAQLQAISQAQRCIGRDISTGSLWQRGRLAIQMISILITWAMENAIETADSMRSRGYGLPGRTAFSIYRFTRRDKLALLWLCSNGVLLGAGWWLGGLSWQYYPLLQVSWDTPLSAGTQLLYLFLCITPIILNYREAQQWTRLRSSL